MSGNLTAYSLSELSLFVVSIMTAGGGLLAVFFKGITRSRCSDINCCCGLLKCERKPPTVEELRVMNEDDKPILPDIEEDKSSLPVTEEENNV